MSIADLTCEIAFQKVLLSSIDDSVANREEAEHEVKTEIKALERHLKELVDGTKKSKGKDKDLSRGRKSPPEFASFDGPSDASTIDPGAMDNSWFSEELRQGMRPCFISLLPPKLSSKDLPPLSLKFSLWHLLSTFDLLPATSSQI